MDVLVYLTDARRVGCRPYPLLIPVDSRGVDLPFARLKVERVMRIGISIQDLSDYASVGILAGGLTKDLGGKKVGKAVRRCASIICGTIILDCFEVAGQSTRCECNVGVVCHGALGVCHPPKPRVILDFATGAGGIGAVVACRVDRVVGIDGHPSRQEGG